MASTKFYRTCKSNHLTWLCPGCDKTFALYSKQNQVQHLYTHLPVQERPFKCTECLACYVQTSQLDIHFKKVHILNKKCKFPTNNNSLSTDELFTIRSEITQLTENKISLSSRIDKP